MTKTQLKITNDSQEASPFPAGDHKAHVYQAQLRDCMSNHEAALSRWIRHAFSKLRLEIFISVFIKRRETGILFISLPIGSLLKLAIMT